MDINLLAQCLLVSPDEITRKQNEAFLNEVI